MKKSHVRRIKYGKTSESKISQRKREEAGTKPDIYSTNCMRKLHISLFDATHHSDSIISVYTTELLGGKTEELRAPR